MRSYAFGLVPSFTQMVVQESSHRGSWSVSAMLLKSALAYG